MTKERLVGVRPSGTAVFSRWHPGPGGSHPPSTGDQLFRPRSLETGDRTLSQLAEPSRNDQKG
jgi:hypothetical protein